MPTETIEARLTALEQKMERLLGDEPGAQAPATWLAQWFGAFKDSPEFDAAMERGAAYRRSQPTAADEDDAHAPA
ncbi:MAG: hypothetical protein M3Y28_03495 [Armatimonadota bacterium]|nr:hypothetical protein [Armatimonadota bacterium]